MLTLGKTKKIFRLLSLNRIFVTIFAGDFVWAL